MGLLRLILDVSDLEPERSNYRSERVYLSLLGLILSLKEPDFGLRAQTQVQTYRQMDLSKFTPLGPLPIKDLLTDGQMKGQTKLDLELHCTRLKRKW